ncbi:hypothetical protein [Heyndrickxia ginsengihumi]|uniref:hypothetical protein n=1 Tax=Heyndrickxia ginsengihumi TaxID=363870 RepID=UPI0020421E18|nr:hypothetical protein [Heyndrickxia ginsengihumi]MCM3022327.1 hypothetical protein [Heyndrickxia ginsengihumi]
MKKIINRKVYDTEKSCLISEHSNGSSNKHIYEGLYITKNGQFFLHAEGGPLTKYSESDGSTTWGIETIILLTPNEAYKWLERNDKFEEIEEYFPEFISEG